MFVYIRSEPGLWTVGHYAPGGEWISESDHNTPDAAAARVAELNGGTTTEADGRPVPWRWNKPAAQVMAAFLAAVADSAAGRYPNPDDYPAIAAGLMFSLAILNHRDQMTTNTHARLMEAARRCVAMVPAPPKDEDE